MIKYYDADFERAKRMLRTSYVIRADSRQKKMGLSYVEAELSDLAKMIARFAKLVRDEEREVETQIVALLEKVAHDRERNLKSTDKAKRG